MQSRTEQTLLSLMVTYSCFFAVWIVRVLWILFSQAAGVILDKLVKWRPEALEVMGLAGLSCFCPLQCPPVLQGEGYEQCHGALQLFALSGLGRMMHLTVRVKSNLQVKLEIVEGKVSEMKETGL